MGERKRVGEKKNKDGGGGHDAPKMGLDGAKVGGGHLKRMRRQAEIDLKMIIDEVKNIFMETGSVEDRSADTVSLMSSSTSIMLKL